MSERIPLRYTVALLGFPPAELSALATFFRLAEQRTPAYEQAGSLAEADFLVVNADHAPTTAEVRQAHRLADALFIGTLPPPDAAARLSRPVAPTHIVRELDALLEQRLARLEAPEPDWVGSQPGLLGAAGGALPSRDVLVVDDSRIALRFLQVRLQQRGYRVHVAATPEAALERVAAQPFVLVFLDVSLGPQASMDGLALCQRIRQSRAHTGHPTPKIAMVTALSSSSDRVRGELAGCDAYLVKPLMDPDLDDALRLLDPSAATA